MAQLNEQTLFAERYLLQRLLGRGGFSEVWLATDQMTNLEIAVKVYAPGQGMEEDGMKDFCKELSNVYNLNHTNLLKPQHVDNWQGMPYLVMTYCPKGSCQKKIGTMSEDELWKLLADVASGLAYLHDQGIIHQDIKPDNILVDTLGNYVITDFGISIQSRSTLRKSMNVATGSGTTAYMGPERFSVDPTPIKASDIWSLGATAYELITGNAPFGEIGGGLQKGGADLPTIKQNISSNLRLVLAKMLALDPWDRPTAEQIAHWAQDPASMDINESPSASNGASRPTTRQTPILDQQISPSRKSKKKSWIIGILVTVVLALCGGVVVFMKQKEDEEKAIHIQVDLMKGCDECISDLRFDDLGKLDEAVKKLRELEEFENNSSFSPNLKRKLLPKEMKDLKDKLATLKIINEFKLESDYADYDKEGPTYTNCVRRIDRLGKVLSCFETNQNVSPHDIHIISDNFN